MIQQQHQVPLPQLHQKLIQHHHQALIHNGETFEKTLHKLEKVEYRIFVRGCPSWDDLNVEESLMEALQFRGLRFSRHSRKTRNREFETKSRCAFIMVGTLKRAQAIVKKKKTLWNGVNST